MVIGWQRRSSSAEQTRATEARIHRGGADLWTRGRVGERTVRRIDPHVTRIIDRQDAAGFGRGCSRMRKCEIGRLRAPASRRTRREDGTDVPVYPDDRTVR